MVRLKPFPKCIVEQTFSGLYPDGDVVCECKCPNRPPCGPVYLEVTRPGPQGDVGRAGELMSKWACRRCFYHVIEASSCFVRLSSRLLFLRFHFFLLPTQPLILRISLNKCGIDITAKVSAPRSENRRSSTRTATSVLLRVELEIDLTRPRINFLPMSQRRSGLGRARVLTVEQLRWVCSHAARLMLL